MDKAVDNIPNPVDSAPKSETPRQSPLAKVEGYIALFLAFVFVLCLMSLRWITGDFVIEGVILLAIWVCAWLFAISGFRHGTGVARVAAVLGLTILVLHVLVVLVMAYH